MMQMAGAQTLHERITEPGLPRIVAWMLIGIAEVLATSYLFEINAVGDPTRNPIYYATSLVRLLLIATPFFAFLVWPRRQGIVETWARFQATHNWTRALAFNLALFAMLAAASVYITHEAAQRGAPPWELLPPFLALVAATGLSILRIDVPLRALAEIAWSERWAVLISLAAGILVTLASNEVIAIFWPVLADATLSISGAIVSLVMPSVVVDPIERSLGTNSFKVIVDQSCSGYEGLALVTGFVSIYLWTFRKSLRFPAAFLLYPLGLSAIWLLNSVRIAVLTLIGANLSPQIAAQGFHSQAGWMAFLLVSIGLTLLSRKLNLMAVRPTTGTIARVRSRAEIFVLPFIALMAGTMLAQMLAPYDRAAYVIKAGLVAAVLLSLRRYLVPAVERTSWLAVAAGGAIGLAWIVSDPGAGQPHGMGDWLLSLGPGLAFLWLAVRGIGTIVLVPIAEELAFRGYLYRRFIARDFESVPAMQISWLGLVVSSVLFGVLHERWLAGSLAGVIFALVMIRTGRVRDAIVAHAIANAMIFAWALAFRQWSLL